MALNLTQEFVFETDSLKSAESMLRALIPILFHENGKHCQLHLRTEKQPLSFEGVDRFEMLRYYDQRKPVVGLQNKYYLLNPDGMYHGTSFHTPSSPFSSKDAAAQASCDDFDKISKPKPSRFWLATLGDYQGDSQGQKLCKDYPDLLNNAMALLCDTSRHDEFFATCGDGYHDGFRGFDGSIDVGFRFDKRPNGGWNVLDISLTHIYYGK